jgi:hypothetical protein
MYVKEFGMTPLAYVYKAEHRDYVEQLLASLNKRRRELRDYEAVILYRELPKVRADAPDRGALPEKLIK